MTDSKKQPKPETAKPAPQAGSELSETDLNQASGGALNAYTPVPTDSTHSTGGGGGAGKTVLGDGSVKTSLIGLL
jgi:hypothetical protein